MASRKKDGVPEYCGILDRWGYFVVECMNPETAKMIVEAVNEFAEKQRGTRTPNAGGCKHQSEAAGETAPVEKRGKKE
jgi:hypothetical protein